MALFDEKCTRQVKTTLPKQPFPPNAERAPVETARLILRPFTPEDITASHELRTQIEVMSWTATGRIDADVAETQKRLDLMIPPRDTERYNFVICWRETGELIGWGGCHQMGGSFGWPELGYMLKKEYWGKGLATEFVAAFARLYARLPREEVDLLVRPSSVPEGQGEAEELLVANVVAHNPASLKVMEKAGAERFLEYREIDFGDPTGKAEIDIVSFRFFPGRLAKE